MVFLVTLCNIYNVLALKAIMFTFYEAM
jgi:hypothetical protein